MAPLRWRWDRADPFDGREYRVTEEEIRRRLEELLEDN
jgi:hypothetical protein